MQQQVRVMGTAELQALVARIGGRVVRQVPGKTAYQGTGGIFLVAASLPDGRQKVIITQGSCSC